MKSAVILAAGRGSRLTTVSAGMPKCLMEVGGQTLIGRQLDLLESVGVERVCVVVGHRADAVRESLGDRCTYVLNERYAETNSLYSMWLARRFTDDGFLLMNSDIVAHPDIYNRVLAMNGCALAYDSREGHGDEEAMNVEIDDGRVVALGKDLPVERVHGENVGILRFDAASAARLMEIAESMVGAEGDRAWAPAAVSRLAAEHAVRAVDVADLPWTEIDFPDDLSRAERSVCPVIEHGHWVLRSDPASARRSG